jgi:hypothetical protein
MKPFSYLCNVEFVEMLKEKMVKVGQQLNFGNGGFANGTVHQN